MPPRKKQPDEPSVYVAKTSGAIKVKGQLYRFAAGVTRVRVDHPLRKAHPHLFEPMALDLEIEQATAAPGERR